MHENPNKKYENLKNFMIIIYLVHQLFFVVTISQIHAICKNSEKEVLESTKMGRRREKRQEKIKPKILSTEA